MAATPPDVRKRLPDFLLEDYLGVLRTLVWLAWGGLAAMLAVEAWVRLSPDLTWPRLGGFSTTYNMILLEFALNTAVLTALLVRRDWYERVPRASAGRVRWLLVAVIVSAGFHYFAAFHVVGSIGGPLLPLLPVLLIGAFLAFPRRGAWATAAYLLAGHAAVLVLERYEFLQPRGDLADAFALYGPTTRLGGITLFVILGAALVLASLAHRRLDEAGAVLHRSSRLNPLTGLYTPEFLRERITAELGRARRQGGALALLFLEFEGFAEYTALHGYEAGRDRLREAAQVLIGSVRPRLDTPARYASTLFAVLLPTAGVEGARKVAERIRDHVAQLPALHGNPLKVRTGVAAVSQPNGLTPARMIAAADAALSKARGANSEIEVVDVSEPR